MADKRDWLIEEAFAFYCGAEVNTPPASLIGQRAADLIVDAAKGSIRRFQTSVALGTVSVCLVGTTFLNLFGGLYNGFVAVSVVGMFATIGHLYSRPHEPSHQELLGLDLTPEQAKCVEALKEFRRLLADGVIAAHPSSSTGSEDQVPPALFAADGGRLLILGIGDRGAIRPRATKPVGAIRVEWVPQRYAPIGEGSAVDAPTKTPRLEPHCVDVLKGVQSHDFAVWRDELVCMARGTTAERLTGVLNAMYAVANDKERNRSANVIDQILKRVDGSADHYSREAIDKILHGTKSSDDYAYILRYLIARKNGETVHVEVAKRGHPEVRFGSDEVTP
jgi:hypothetical protein